MKIISWNVNGIRAIQKKGFNSWLKKENPDILCLQETKAHPDQLDKFLQSPPGYFSFFSSAERKGYSGVCIYSKIKPINIEYGFGEKRFDSEGRILIVTYDEFILFNIYYPNGKQNQERLNYKMDFYNAFLHIADKKKKQEPLIITGDVNTAHNEIDLARPKENSKVSGFLPEERTWIDTFLSHGYIDAFRHFYPEKVEYTWWDYVTRARERNVGWRIDYFFVTEDFINQVDDVYHLTDIMGSDHCPIGLKLKNKKIED